MPKFISVSISTHPYAHDTVTNTVGHFTAASVWFT